MCYAIPGKVTNITSNIATIDYFGEQKTARNELKDLQVGDFVYAQGGFVIEVVSEKEALDILDAWKETFFALQEIDVNLSRGRPDTSGVSKSITYILDKALEERPLSRPELIQLLSLEDIPSLSLLYKTANYLRQKELGNSCCVHGIIEFSNNCVRSCTYCGISSRILDVHRYRMTFDEIMDAARVAIEDHGFKALVLQSGEDDGRSVDELCAIVRAIKERYPVLLFISFGEIGISGLQRLYDAGARGLLMRFETSNEELYRQVRPGCELKTRLEHLRAAYDMGYLILTGALIGLPGQTREDILNDILLTKELHAEMYSFGPYIPCTEASAGPTSIVPVPDVLKTLALCRVVDPKSAKILVTTGFETIHPQAREEGLMAGANSVMLNVTPDMYKKDYAIYPQRAHSAENISFQIDTTLALLKRLGRAPTDLGM